MRVVVIVVLLAFAVTLAIVLGQRMDTQAMSVVLGVVCGVAAGIPMSMLIILALTRRRDTERGPYSPAVPRQQAPYPPVVVIQGGAPAGGGPIPSYFPQAPEVMPRQFRVIGEDTE